MEFWARSIETQLVLAKLRKLSHPPPRTEPQSNLNQLPMPQSADFKKLERSLKVKFKDKQLLESAFVHRSYLNEHPDFGLPHNERLEFLGDAVLELAVTDYLYHTFPETPEGDMTNWRAALVNAKMLGDIARELGFEAYLYLSRGESKEKGKAREYILANAMEAFIGALYLDQGFSVTEKFLAKHVLGKLPAVFEQKLYRDPKTAFQEAAQEKVGVTPTYQVLKEWGPDHAKQFKIGVFLEADMVASGEGLSKQEAQVEAAENALRVKGW